MKHVVNPVTGCVEFKAHGTVGTMNSLAAMVGSHTMQRSARNKLELAV